MDSVLPIANLGHCLNRDCDIIAISRKGVSDRLYSIGWRSLLRLGYGSRRGPLLWCRGYLSRLCYALALTLGVFRESCGGDRTAAWVAHSARVGICKEFWMDERRSPVSEVKYDHESEVEVIREIPMPKYTISWVNDHARYPLGSQ